MHHKENYDGDPVAKVRELLKDIKWAMLTTLESSRKLVTRPMMARDVEFDGDIWFFTDDRSEKVAQIERNDAVNVAYASKDQNTHLSISGRGSIVRDRAKIREYWRAPDNAYFEGEDDPNLVLLKVEVETVEFWDSPDSRITRTINFFRAMKNHDPTVLGENATLQLRQ